MHPVRVVPLLVLSAAGSGSVWAYSATANVTVNFGGNNGGSPSSGLASFGIPITPKVDLVWTANGPTGVLGSVANSTYFTDLSGFNGVNYYNSDFMSTSRCTSNFGATATTRKYGCRYTTFSGTPRFATTYATDDGPVGRAGGTLTVTDTTLTGALQIMSSTDEPTGAVANQVTTGGAQISSSAGNGTDGYNYRSADGSPFGNYWQGITTQGVLQFALSGSFSATQWQINGGTVQFTDPGFLCQQGGLGNFASDPAAGALCTSTTYSGGHQHNGAGLSWGWDLDGSGPITGISQIEVRDASGTTLISTLSGVLASISIDGAGNITTNKGEFRRADDPTSGCGQILRWDGTRLTCGALTTGKLVMTGQVQAVPVPGALGLGVAALGSLFFTRSRNRANGPA